MKGTKRSKTTPAPVAGAGAPAAPEAVAAEAGPRTNSRRAFLGQLGGAAAVVAVSDLTLGSRKAKAAPRPAGAPNGTWQPLSDEVLLARRDRALQGRIRRAQHWHDEPFHSQLANDDELIHPAWAMFSKSLPHNGLGHPSPAAFAQLVQACNSGRPDDFEAVPLGGVQPLRNPQSGLCFEFCGYDPEQGVVPVAPAFASAWRAGEMVEAYWAAHLRDVPFAEYGTNPLVAQACADLSALSDFRGPKVGGQVTPETIFRGPWKGCLNGPFISQFLLKDLQFGSQPIVQRQRTLAPGIDYMTSYSDWLDRQNGAAWPARVYDPVNRYIRSGRDLATWVDMDPPLQAGLGALLVLLGQGTPLDPANPYGNRILNQDGFTTFGPVEFFDLVGRAPYVAHKHVWFQKWRIHRCIRPEEYGGRVHNHLTGAFSYPLHPDVLNSDAVQEAFSRQGTYLCSQSYPDGCPTHTAYPSGHSVGIGSTVTMLKAMFAEEAEIVDPVEPTPDGLSLQPYTGSTLTVRGELNKLAWNVSCGRLTSSIHWRSDFVEGHRLGQAVSIGILRDMKTGYREPYDGYTLNRFEGNTIRI